MGKVGFGTGWDAAGNVLSEMRQGWNDAEQRKLSRAQRSVLKWEGKSAKKDYQTKKREDYWGTGKFKLSKEQKARIAEAEKSDKERGWDKSDMADAPKLLKQFEQAHEGSKGALAGQFFERETSITKEGKASAKSKMAAAKQAKIKADLDSKISEKYGDKDFQSFADSRVTSEVSAAKLAQANADFRQKEVDDYTDSVTAARAVSETNAESDKKVAAARYMEAVTNQKVAAQKKNEYDDTKTAAQNNTAQIVAIDNQASAVRQKMATIMERDASGKLINSPHEIEEKIRLAIADFARPPVGASESVRTYNETLHKALTSEWTGMGESLLKEDQYVKRKAYEAQKLAARASVSGRRRDAQLKEATEKFGWMGEEDVLARNYLVDRFKTLGVPLSFLNESGPRAGEIFAYQKSAPYNLDAEGNPLAVKGPDGAETKERHMLLDYDVTIATAEAWAKEWLLTNQPIRAERSMSSTTGPASQSGISFNVPTQEQSDAQTTTTRMQTTLQGSPYATTGTPAGRELLPQAQAVKVAEFLDGFRKGHGALSGASLPTPTEEAQPVPQTREGSGDDKAWQVPPIPKPKVSIAAPEPPSPVPWDAADDYDPSLGVPNKRILVPRAGEEGNLGGPTADAITTRSIARRLQRGEKISQTQANILLKKYPLPKSTIEKYPRAADLINEARGGVELEGIEAEILREMNIDPTTGVPFGKVKEAHKVVESLLLKKGTELGNARASHGRIKDKSSQPAREFMDMIKAITKEIDEIKRDYSPYWLTIPKKK